MRFLFLLRGVLPLLCVSTVLFGVACGGEEGRNGKNWLQNDAVSEGNGIAPNVTVTGDASSNFDDDKNIEYIDSESVIDKNVITTTYYLVVRAKRFLTASRVKPA